MISFDNTKVAFSSKSDFELRKSRVLFSIIGRPFMVKLGSWAMGFARMTGFPIGWALRSNIFSHFCGGENIAECAKATKALDLHNVGTILDYSVEGKESEGDFDRTRDEILATIGTAEGNSHIPFCVFKVTGIARFDLLEKINAEQALSTEETAEFDRVKNRVNSICALAEKTGTPVFIDAEDSWIQDVIDSLCNEMMKSWNTQKVIVFNTIQMYRHDRLAFLKKSHEEAKLGGYKIGMKIVRGAYMEKERTRANEMGYPSPIQSDKTSTDRDYDAALRYCVENIEDIAICAGTHNENSSAFLAGLIQEKNIPKNHPHLYFAQLFGMSDHISFNLSNAGFNVAKYVPYGPIREVIPYLIRRAEENTSVSGQTGRELALIQKEIKRRKAARHA